MIREIDVLTGVETSRALTAEEQAKADANTAEEIANAPAPYVAKRREEYDKLNQFEMQFDDQRDGTTTWVDAINGIKDKYPKEI